MTRRKRLVQRAFLAALSTICLSGCGLEGTLSRWTDGLVTDVKTNADTIGTKLGGGLVHGARDSLTTPESSVRLSALVDSLVTAALHSAQRNSPALVDSALGPSLQHRIDSLAGTLRRQTTGLRDDLLGPRTLEYVQTLRDSLLGTTTRERIGLIRDELLGPSTRTEVMMLVDSVLQGPVRRYQANLQQAIHTEAGFFQNNAVTIVIVIAVAAVGIIAFVWWQRRRYRQMVQLLTRQIHGIGDTRVYTDLTDRIKRQAEESGLERSLRKELAAEGILHDPRRHERE